MTFSVFPDVVDALVALFTTALADQEIQVTDGPGVTDDVVDFLAVGVEDPWQDRQDSGDSDRTWATYGASAMQGSNIEERGNVTCLLYRSNGDSDQKRARDDVYAALEACWVALRADTSLGVSEVAWTNITTSRPMQAQTDYGAECAVVFNVNFYAYLSGAS